MGPPDRSQPLPLRCRGATACPCRAAGPSGTHRPTDLAIRAAPQSAHPVGGRGGRVAAVGQLGEVAVAVDLVKHEAVGAVLQARRGINFVQHIYLCSKVANTGKGIDIFVLGFVLHIYFKDTMQLYLDVCQSSEAVVVDLAAVGRFEETVSGAVERRSV